MEIFWTMLASQDRKRIREYIAEQNLMAAIELDERIGYFGRTHRLTPVLHLYYLGPTCARTDTLTPSSYCCH
ncbi:type II toxin-antitoxin system RelE/ParE family toxin [Escherichia coli]|uniref:type II toxin-antitoxin system RelE/ParE family toxin n=1 Tax=Escherichia coli TaxID=562 RepID=UPI003EE23450